MANNNKTKDQSPPKPDPALKRLDRLVGTWNLKGHSLGSKEESITGTTSYKWLHDEEGKSFFLEQDMEMDYDGKLIKSHEIIGYNPKTKAFSSYVYSNLTPEPWPYEWDIQGDDFTISIKYGPIDSAFHAKFSSNGNSFSGGWRPNPGADKDINVSYDVIGTRVN